MRTLSIASVFVALVTIGGCIDLEQEFTLNPDGSGKARIHSVFAPTDFMGSEKDPEVLARKAARDEVEKAEGVDAWKDVSWKLQDDGRILFQGTAYFRDASKVKFHHQGIDAEFLQLKFSKTDAGEITVECPTGKKKGPKGAPKKRTEEELKTEMKAQRAKYQQTRPLMDSMLSSLKMQLKVNLPARVGTTSNFKKAGDTAVSLSVEGKAFAKALDEMMMDDASLRAMIEDGFDLQESDGGLDDSLLQRLFGEKGPIRAVTVAGAKDLFDYEAEAAPARAGMAALLEPLGGEAKKTVAPAAKGEGFKSLRVVGVRVIYDADMESGVSPFNSSKPGVSLALVGELAGSVLAAKEGTLEKAVAGDGSDLLPESDWDRKINWPRLTNDGTGIVFEVEMDLPGDTVKSLKEVAGTIQYTVGGKTKEVDCGFAELKAGAAGKPFHAKIGELKESDFQPDHQQLQLELETSRDAVESVLFYDEAGKALKVEPMGSSSMNDTVSMTFVIEGAFPPKGRIALKVYEDLKTFEIPFSITNIALPARPAK